LPFKQCNKCKEDKELSSFSKHKKHKDGYAYTCKTCTRSKQQSPTGQYSRYKTGAKARGYNFNLTFKQFMSYWQEPCGYCGDDIETIGLDRVDNSEGYISTNLVSCCRFCNVAKNKYSETEFLIKIEKIYLKHIGGE
jgi:hypothetical protein